MATRGDSWSSRRNARWLATKETPLVLKLERPASIHVSSNQLAHSMSCTADAVIAAGPASMRTVHSVTG